MLRSVSRLIVGVVCLAAMASLQPVRAEDEQASDLKFRMKIVSEITSPDKESLIVSAIFGYRFHREKNVVLVSLQHLEFENRDKKSSTHKIINKDKFYTKIGETVQEDVDRTTMHEGQKKIADGLFDTPLWKLSVDSEGKEVKREDLPQNDTIANIAKGMINNTRLFHVRFPVKETQWEADNAVMIDGENAARGKLKYEKQKADQPDGLIPVKVSGALESKGKPAAGESLAMDVHYDVEGKQFFDPKLAEWTQGELKVKARMDFFDKGKLQFTTTADMKVTLTLLPLK